MLWSHGVKGNMGKERQKDRFQREEDGKWPKQDKKNRAYRQQLRNLTTVGKIDLDELEDLEFEE